MQTSANQARFAIANSLCYGTPGYQVQANSGCFEDIRNQNEQQYVARV
jgi:hypothetical protein